MRLAPHESAVALALRARLIDALGAQRGNVINPLLPWDLGWL